MFLEATEKSDIGHRSLTVAYFLPVPKPEPVQARSDLTDDFGIRVGDSEGPAVAALGVEDAGKKALRTFI